MASIRQDILIERPAAAVWAAMRDVGALHTRLASGFIRDCVLDGDCRIVTFASGLTARERIITIDDATRRLVWSVVGGRLSHHNASTQVFDTADDRCRVVWCCDLLPAELAPVIAGMIDEGMVDMKRTLEQAAS